MTGYLAHAAHHNRFTPLSPFAGSSSAPAWWIPDRNRLLPSLLLTYVLSHSRGTPLSTSSKSAVPCRGRECPSRGQCATVDDRPHIALAPVAAGTPGAPAPLAKSHAAVSGACLHHPRHICRQTSMGLTCSCKTHPYPPRLITTTQPSTPPSKNRQLLPPTQLGPITLAGPNTTLSLPAAHCSRGAQLSEAALNHHAGRSSDKSV